VLLQVVEEPRRVVLGVLLALGVQHEVVSEEQEPAQPANEARHEGDDLDLGGLGLRHFGGNLAETWRKRLSRDMEPIAMYAGSAERPADCSRHTSEKARTAASGEPSNAKVRT
jgi:hypothetical protein